MIIKIMQNVLAANAEKAQSIRNLLKEKKVTMLNLISSPGSGKTTILEKILPSLKNLLNIAIIEGDVETTRDAERLAKFAIPVSLINTSGACHLESISIEKALESFDLDSLDLIFVENVGNLVCPAEFDIGETAKIGIISVPEGDDKLLKYPLLFREAQLLLLNKIDVLNYTNFSKEKFYGDLQELNPKLPVLETSCITGEGIEILKNKILNFCNN
jgi:hydrogenase nickel incorporation protein HypB